jgi:hypothetical protein
MRGACSMHRRYEKIHTELWSGNIRRREQGGRIILNRILQKPGVE